MSEKLWLNLLPQKVRSWADASDDDDVSHLFNKSSLSLEDFARCIHNMIQRCELDLESGKTVYHYQIDDTFIDLMFRDHLIVSVSRM